MMRKKMMNPVAIPTEYVLLKLDRLGMETILSSPNDLNFEIACFWLESMRT
jgi:hypothetical protein